jgi:hypothetical protein
MGAILTRYKIGGAIDATAELAVVKAHLRLEHTEEDVMLTGLIVSAKTLADSYTNNTFKDAAGADVAIPEPVGEWILAHVARAYERRAEGLDSAGIGGLTGSVKWAEGIDYALIDPYRLIPGI